MKRQFRNLLYGDIELLGLSVSDFTFSEAMSGVSPVYIITHLPSQLTFRFRNHSENPDSFDCFFERYSPGYPTPVSVGPVPPENYWKFEEAEREFMEWLETDVKAYLNDSLMPDLWGLLEEQKRASTSPRSIDTSLFSEAERDQLRVSLDTFHLLIVERFHPTEVQEEAISEQLNYLKRAVDRLNKFDWKSVAMSSLISISVALCLDTNSGRKLYGLFQQAMSAVVPLCQHA